MNKSVSTTARIGGVVLLTAVFPVAVSLLARALLGDAQHVREPLHEAVEVAGTCIALAVALLLLLRTKHEEDSQHLLWVAFSLVAMGLVDGIHGVHGISLFSWQRHGATLLGGVLFGLVWFPPPAMAVRRKGFSVCFVAGLAVALGLWWGSSGMPVTWHADGLYILPVKAANWIGGAGFLAAALFFCRRYLRNGHPENLVFAGHTVLFGTASFLFSVSHTWAADWWVTHSFRLLAYCVLLVAAYQVVVTLYRQIVERAQEQDTRVQERTAELSRANEILQGQIAERARAEEWLKDSEERFRSFFKLTADLACIARLSDARFVELNQAWANTLGYTEEELMSRSFIDFIHPEDKEPTLRVVREKLERGELVLRFENRYLRKDGGVVWLEWTSQPFAANDRTFALARDVTPRKLDEQAAAQRDWIKSGIVELNDAVRGDFDLHSLCEKGLAQIAGRLEAKVGAVYVVTRPEAGPHLALMGGYALQVRKGRSERFAFGEGLVGQAAAQQATIRVRDVPADYASIVSGTGETPARHVIVVPLTLEGRLKGVVELGSLNEFTALQQQFLEQAMAVLGVAVEAAQSRDALSEAFQHSQQLSEELQAQQEELRATNEELEAQTRALTASEQKLRAQQEELAVANEELSEKTRLLERRNDELERTRRGLEEKARELVQASRYKSQFLANMSHELRTPLNSLLLLAQSLADNKQGNLLDDQVEAANVIHGSGLDLLKLITDILDLAKIEAGRTELTIEPLVLEDVVLRLRASFGPLAQKKGLALRFETAPDCPPQIVTDGKRFEQVLRNLLSNAVKFTETGEVQVAFGRPADGADLTARGLAPDNCLAVLVRDTGIGIAPEHQKLVFEAFQQAEGGINRRYGGTGLGLAISRELARLLGGEIRLLSEPGKGSTFTLLVPVEHPSVNEPQASLGTGAGEAPAEPGDRLVSEPTPIEARAALPFQAAPVGGPASEEEPQRVLVVEDHPADRRAIVNLISERDIAVAEAQTGEEAVAALRQGRFDCVVLDLTLPDFSGLEVVQRLRREGVPLPPVVVYTSCDLSREEERELREHTDAIVLKGLRSTERLLDEVSLFLHQLVDRQPERRRPLVSRLHDSDQQLRDRKVLVYCPIRRFTTIDLGEDGVGILGPGERLRVGVVVREVVVDGREEFLDASEYASSNPLARDLAEPSLHHVQP